MKKCNQAVLVILAWLVLATNIFAQVTNDFFYPEEPEERNYYPDVSDKSRKEHDARLREAAVEAGECKPSELDTNGHWGLVVHGFQSSIRSKTNIFIAGKSIPMSVIFRNTTTNTLSRPNISNGMESSLVVEDATGQVAQYDSYKFNPGGSFYGFRPFAPKHQVKNEYDLNTQFSLKAGMYTIRAETRVFELSPMTNKIASYTNLYSGVLTIKVISP